MITLYDIDATTEICILDEVLECLVTEEQNSIFELEMTYSIYSSNFSDLKSNKVLKAKASDELGEQLFRIYYVSNEIDGRIYIKAQHITYDLIDNFIEGVTCTNSTCEQSFNSMLNKCQIPHNFRGYSDIEHTSTYNVNRCNALESILGMKGSLLDTYGNGAKLKRDNYNIYLNKTRGNNNGVTIEYSKNITGYKREIDETGVITCIYPFSKIQNETEEGSSVEETIVLPERFVNSQYINNYPHPKILAVDYSEREVKDIASLRTQANKYFSETKKDIPNINYKVEFIYLHQTAEYENLNLKALELVGMGDTVIVKDERIGMDVEADVIKTVFNVLSNRYESIELGNFKTGISDIIGELETSVDNALNQVNNIYTNFEVLDDKIISEVSKLEGDVKNNTTLIQQTAESIDQIAKDVKGNTSLIQQTSSQISNKVSNGEFESYKTQTAQLISSKVGSDNLNSILEQNPTSIQIGFNKINDNVVIDSNSMKFKDSAGNQSLSFMRGSLYAYEPNSSVFMGAGLIPRWNSGSYNAGFGVLAGSNSYYYSIARASNWGSDTSSNPGSIEEYFIINYRDRGSALSQRQGCHTYYKLYTSGGINGMGYDIENVSTTKTLDLNVGTIRNTNGSQAFVLGSSSITNGMNWNFNYFTLSNVYISTSGSCSLGATSCSSMQTGTYKSSTGTTLFTAYSTVNNSVGWAWNRNNLLDPYIIGGVYGYSIEEGNSNTRNINNADLDNILDSIDIYVSESNAKSNNSKSLEIDVSNLRNNKNSNLFIKEREITDFETGEVKTVENIDMKSMLHLALLEIKNLKEEVRVLKNKSI